MGLKELEEAESKRAKKQRGSTNNKKRLDAFKAGRETVEAGWDGCDPKLLQSVVVEITRLGGAVTIGLSRDRGAHSLTLLLDNDRTTMWFNGNADLDDELKSVLGTLDQMKG